VQLTEHRKNLVNQLVNIHTMHQLIEQH